MKIGIAGLGLIGGSFARALSELTHHTVFGWNRSEPTLRKAKLIDVIDDFLTDENIGECDFILIALYPDATIEWLKRNAAKIGKGAIVMDACGVKGAVCPPCEATAAEHGFTFIGAHPMAGVEHCGFDFSSAGMFSGASMILTPPSNAPIDAIARAKALALEIGFARVVITDAAEHDRMIAYTSQMAHVVSSAYVQSPCSARHKGFSAGSYRDMTRVACLNEDMWTELFMDNSATLASELGEMIERLTRFRDAIRDRDAKRVHAMLRAGRVQKEDADGKTL